MAGGDETHSGGEATPVRVELPHHLRTLANVGGEVTVVVTGVPTQRTLLDALEQQYPALRGTIRDHASLRRRAYLRFYACQEDLSHQPADAALPEAVASGREPFLIIGAMSGG